MPALLPEQHVGGSASLPPQLPLAASGVQRWVWQGRYGPMLIEVVGQQVRVNGQPVVAYSTDSQPPST